MLRRPAHASSEGFRSIRRFEWGSNTSARGFRAENVPFAAYTPEPVRKRPLKEGDATLALAQFPFLQDNKLPTYSKQSLRSLRATTNRSLSI
ncbi:hypothetical protein PC129_g1304 [Phytophthora cactorum]|uniref:Uncharacterized protein n=1 Tax=Phytophthora cactorum TaxID=29920 RepID=A0A8T1IZ67_9STRA|nr:hypothetical protein PC114_g3617 [Phytophthora cactorum]KAG2939141.1 hypothetical protein PC115_g3282 [Phytophthora cactorum]KAG3228172.1 hypothetical protein PC129_g1304 [Phytophthora cactorum]KAG4248425.1 hypothetical protein PC116_g3852 [Phytophthora cactorum]